MFTKKTIRIKVFLFYPNLQNVEKFITDIVRFNQVEDRIFVLRDQKVILDSDVAALYGVQTTIELNLAMAKGETYR